MIPKKPPSSTATALREKYKSAFASHSLIKRRKKILLSDLFVEPLFEMKVQVEKQDEENEVEENVLNLRIEDLFEKDSREEHPPRRVLIYGEAGSGKTMLSKKIAFDWASDRAFTEFDFLFLLPIGKIKERQKILTSSDSMSFISNAVGLSVLDDEDRVLEIKNDIKNTKSRILFILDGVDEADSKILEKLEKLLEHPDFFILMTSRSQGGDFLELEVDRVVKNLGFSDEMIESYVQKNLPHSWGDFLEQLKKYPQSFSLAHIPLNLEMLCAIWEKEGAFPTTQTEIYTQVVGGFWKEYWRRIRTSEEKVSPDKKKALRDSLGAIAREGLRKRGAGVDLMDAESALEPKVDNLDELIQTGLLKKSGESYYFIHDTFQEYFCALHLSQNESLLDTFLRENGLNPRYSNVISFVAGLVSEKEKFIDGLMNQLGDLGGVYQMDLLLKAIFECNPDPDVEKPLLNRCLDAFHRMLLEDRRGPTSFVNSILRSENSFLIEQVQQLLIEEIVFARDRRVSTSIYLMLEQVCHSHPLSKGLVTNLIEFFGEEVELGHYSNRGWSGYLAEREWIGTILKRQRLDASDLSLVLAKGILLNGHHEKSNFIAHLSKITEDPIARDLLIDAIIRERIFLLDPYRFPISDVLSRVVRDEESKERFSEQLLRWFKSLESTPFRVSAIHSLKHRSNHLQISRSIEEYLLEFSEKDALVKKGILPSERVDPHPMDKTSWELFEEMNEDGWDVNKIDELRKLLASTNPNHRSIAAEFLADILIFAHFENHFPDWGMDLLLPLLSDSEIDVVESALEVMEMISIDQNLSSEVLGHLEFLLEHEDPRVRIQVADIFKEASRRHKISFSAIEKIAGLLHLDQNEPFRTPVLSVLHGISSRQQIDGPILDLLINEAFSQVEAFKGEVTRKEVSNILSCSQLNSSQIEGLIEKLGAKDVRERSTAKDFLISYGKVFKLSSSHLDLLIQNLESINFDVRTTSGVVLLEVATHQQYNEKVLNRIEEISIVHHDASCRRTASNLHSRLQGRDGILFVNTAITPMLKDWSSASQIFFQELFFSSNYGQVTFPFNLLINCFHSWNYPNVMSTCSWIESYFKRISTNAIFGLMKVYNDEIVFYLLMEKAIQEEGPLFFRMERGKILFCLGDGQTVREYEISEKEKKQYLEWAKKLSPFKDLFHTPYNSP